MSLDLYLQKDAGLPKSGENCFLEFEDDGYYWFLYEYFKGLSEQTSQVIDRCEDAFFKGDDLELFDQMIEKAKKAILEKPDVWEEFIGTTFEKGAKTKVEKIYSTVYKKELESILAKLKKAVSKAREKNIGIFFFGD